MIYFLSAVPNYVSGTLTCPMPPNAPPAETKMIVSPDQPITMCPGKKAVYECDAGGINVRFVSIFSKGPIRTDNYMVISCNVLYGWLIFACVYRELHKQYQMIL